MSLDPAGGHGYLSLVSIACSQEEVSASGRSPIQRNPAEFGVPKCDREALVMRKLWPTRCCRAMGEKNVIMRLYGKYDTALLNAVSCALLETAVPCLNQCVSPFFRVSQICSRIVVRA